jgi:hypothetical protein
MYACWDRRRRGGERELERDLSFESSVDVKGENGGLTRKNMITTRIPQKISFVDADIGRYGPNSGKA